MVCTRRRRIQLNGHHDLSLYSQSFLNEPLKINYALAVGAESWECMSMLFDKFQSLLIPLSKSVPCEEDSFLSLCTALNNPILLAFLAIERASGRNANANPDQLLGIPGIHFQPFTLAAIE